MDLLLKPGSHDQVSIRSLSDPELGDLNIQRKLSLAIEDLRSIRDHFERLKREPTDVELEVIAQTWSEHCKHRIFNAVIHHRGTDLEERIDGLFPTLIRDLTQSLMQRKPDFVLSAFHDNAGFIRLDPHLAVGLKVETHNHPSAIEPYAGANTGLGGVIRDILGAGQGAKPVASLDVFCLGRPDTDPTTLPAGSVIHPLGILRGVVHGVRDYGNRMGIPTLAGAIYFEDGYCFNPLVFCGTVGVLPIERIAKRVAPGHRIIVLGGRTGRDGLRGATFSSASLDSSSRIEDQGAVQIGNPIEEKKAADCVLHARDENLIQFITDCGAGGLSSAVGEMADQHGAVVHLERVPLKAPGLSAWEIFLSESQERMVLAVRPEDKAQLNELATLYETECVDIGEIRDDGLLRIYYDATEVGCLDTAFLHEAPRKTLPSHHQQPPDSGCRIQSADRDWSADLESLLEDFNIGSREPIIREYDHEVQGLTFGKPLSGPGGDSPADGAVFGIEGSSPCVALGLSTLPAWHAHPYRMAQATVDEAIRQLVVVGADPDRIAVLDNFCAGDPYDPTVLGALVETVKGMSEAARIAAVPFISGKDSFFNCYETDTGLQSIPTTLLVSALGLIADRAHITPAQIRRSDSLIGLLGPTQPEMGGSVYARYRGFMEGDIPLWRGEEALQGYRRFHQAIRGGWILSAHDIAEGGLAVALAETGFALKAGLEIDLDALPSDLDLSTAEALFAESTGRIVFEIAPEHETALRQHFEGLPFAIIGSTTSTHANLSVRHLQQHIIDVPLKHLKEIWKNSLTPYY